MTFDAFVHRVWAAIAQWIGEHKVGALVLVAIAMCWLAARCPRCFWGNVMPFRNRRTGGVFSGCSRYPRCDY